MCREHPCGLLRTATQTGHDRALGVGDVHCQGLQVLDDHGILRFNHFSRFSRFSRFNPPPNVVGGKGGVTLPYLWFDTLVKCQTPPKKMNLLLLVPV
jgi:hypothetical protein